MATTSSIVRVLVVDDHRLLGESLQTLLDEFGVEVVRLADHPDEALEVLETEPVDVVLLDLYYPGDEAFDYIPRIIAAHPDTKVVIFSASARAGDITRSVAAGASGFFNKNQGIVRLVEVIKRVCEGESLIATEVLRSVALGDTSRHASLTNREYEVLSLMVHGKSAAAVAQATNTSYSTARTHIQNILMKLGVHSRLEAVAYAIAHDLLPVDPLNQQHAHQREISR